MNCQYHALEKDLNLKKRDYDKLSKKLNMFSEEKKTLEKELEENRHQIDVLESVLKNHLEKEDHRQNYERIKENIIIYLHSCSATLDEILAYLKSLEIKLSKEELYNLLNDINKEICIEDRRQVCFPKRYKISEPFYISNQILSIDRLEDNQSYTFFLMGDYHVTECSKNVFKVMDKTFNYCKKNNIELIVNLGDLFNFNARTLEDEVNEILAYVIENMPYDKDIHQAILGGNHDLEAIRFGKDIIKSLCTAREDCISIGYDKAALEFNHIKDHFLLAHTLSGITKDGRELNCSSSKNEILESNNKIYRGNNNLFFTFVAHSHKSFFNLGEGYAIVPSMTKDFYQNSAYKVTVYFAKNRIDYMDIHLLNIDQNMKKTTEITVGQPHILKKK